MGDQSGWLQIGMGPWVGGFQVGVGGFRPAWVASAQHGPCVVVGPIQQELNSPRLKSRCVVLWRRRRAWLTMARRRNCDELGRELRRALLRFGSPSNHLGFWIWLQISRLNFSTLRSLQLFFFYVEIWVWDRRLHWRKQFHNIPRILSLFDLIWVFLNFFFGYFWEWLVHDLDLNFFLAYKLSIRDSISR